VAVVADLQVAVHPILPLVLMEALVAGVVVIALIVE
jgi:hypothetical protein